MGFGFDLIYGRLFAAIRQVWNYQRLGLSSTLSIECDGGFCDFDPFHVSVTGGRTRRHCSISTVFSLDGTSFSEATLHDTAHSLVHTLIIRPISGTTWQSRPGVLYYWKILVRMP